MDLELYIYLVSAPFPLSASFVCYAWGGETDPFCKHVEKRKDCLRWTSPGKASKASQFVRRGKTYLGRPRHMALEWNC